MNRIGRAIALTAACLVGLLVVLRLARPQPSSVPADSRGTTRRAFIEDAIRTTSADIALGNLNAQIKQVEAVSERGELLTVSQGAALVELLGARGQYTGSIADRERALDVAEDVARRFPTEPVAQLSRAHGRAAFHRFAEALADLEHAARLGASASVVDGMRATVFQGLGRYDEALAIRRTAAQRAPNTETLGALASLQAERGAVDDAAQLFEEARWSYRDVSPLPLAFLYFDEGSMWMRRGDLGRARALFEAALRHVPGYAAACRNLAEVDDALGDLEHAIGVLEPVAQTSDDPEIAALYARLLAAAHRPDDARVWHAAAARRYDELVAAHPDAYGPHAAEFWLGTDKALRLPVARYAPAPRRLALVSW